MKFSDYVEHLIKSRGVVQRFIAKKINVSPSFISRWKQDRHPTFEQLQGLSSVLRLDKDEKRKLYKAYIYARRHPEAQKALEYLEK